MRQSNLKYHGHRSTGGHRALRRPPHGGGTATTERDTRRTGMPSRPPTTADADRVLGVLAVLPEQLGKVRAASGEERLLIGVLEQAVYCYQQYVAATQPHKQRLFREAEQWIMEPCPSAPLTFSEVCEFLDLDPGYLRTHLSRWREEVTRRVGSTVAPPASGDAVCRSDCESSTGRTADFPAVG